MFESVVGEITSVHLWTDVLFSLILSAEVEPFAAGQFTRIGAEVGGRRIQRAYSYVNTPDDRGLEFYIARVPGGRLSNFLYELKPGDSVAVDRKPRGSLIVRNVPERENLWLLSSGTALGVYLSILGVQEELERFERIVLVHAVRFLREISYLPRLRSLEELYDGRLKIRLVLSREQIDGCMFGHIPDLLADGSLETSADLRLNCENSHVMLCGNPLMIRRTKQILQEKYGMQEGSGEMIGNVSSERYW